MTAESGGRDWTGADLAVVVGDYVAQLEKVLAGKPVDRAAHDRTVRFVTGKADGPISWKQGEIDLHRPRRRGAPRLWRRSTADPRARVRQHQ